jgi:hypothetical protein
MRDKRERFGRPFPTRKPKLAKKAQPMGLSGVLELIDTPHLFQLIENLRLAGRLTLISGDEIVDVYFEKGKVVYAESEHNKIKLGSLLIKKGLVTKEHAQEALDIFNEEGGRRRIGEILIDLGYITKAKLEEAIVSQIKISIASTLLWKSGDFEFVADEHPPIGDFAMDINLQVLIIEVMRRSDEKTHAESQ